MANPVLVVGSTGLDTIHTETQTVEDVIGGSSIYFAASAALFSPVQLVTVVGSDFPLDSLSALSARGVDTTGVEVIEGGKTFRWAGRYSADMNSRETLNTELNVLGEFSPKLPDNYKDAPYVFLANGPTATQHAVLDQMESKAWVAADTMNLWISNELAELKRLLGRIDMLILNDEEANMLTEIPAPWQAATAIQKMGPNTVTLKKGEHGSYIVSGNSRSATLSYPIDTLIDPTGAGDSFAGAFMGYVAQQDSTEPEVLRRALAVASVVASFTCEAFGPGRLLEVTTEDVETRLATLKELVRI